MESSSLAIGRNRGGLTTIGITMNGDKEVLGLWLAQTTPSCT